MALKIINPGMLTTVQDLGRTGQRRVGLPTGGAVDAYALHLANLLVGNEPGSAGLEMTMVGAEIEAQRDLLIAVSGANMGGTELNRPRWLRSGERLKFAAATSGARAYLAVAGGIDVPIILGGRGTDLRSGIGGWQGRALRKGDVLPVGSVQRDIVGHWVIDPRMLPPYKHDPVLRTVRGTHAGEFTHEIDRDVYQVSAHSDRMGLRLQGTKLERNNAVELMSSAVSPGTVQVPPNGEPIVLLADAQTMGGYPRIAHVIHADWPLLAQLRPGDSVRFKTVELAEAQRAWREQERHLGFLRQGLREKFR